MKNNFKLGVKDFKEGSKKINNQVNQELREIFKDFIKPNVMIRLKEEIKIMPEFFNELFEMYTIDRRMITAFGKDDIDYDICLNLSTINWFLMLTTKDENEKSKRYKDSKLCK